VAAVLVGPFVYRVPIDAIDFKAKLKGPSRAHPLGTDDLGQICSRACSTAAASRSPSRDAIADLDHHRHQRGRLAGQLGGAADHTLMRLTDLFLSLPQLPCCC